MAVWRAPDRRAAERPDKRSATNRRRSRPGWWPGRGRPTATASVLDQRPRRVLIVSAFVLPHVGGVEVIVRQQAEWFAELGSDTTVVTSDADGTCPDGGRGYRIVGNRAWNGLERRGVPYPIWGPRGFWRLGRLLRECDVVHVHDVTYLSSLAGVVGARLLGRPLVLTQHVAEVAHDSHLVEFVQRAVYRTWGRPAWRWAQSITVYNPIVQRFLVASGVDAGKIRLGYNGIDTEFFSPGAGNDRELIRRRYGLPLDKPVVLFVGRLVPKKGVHRLLAACSADYHIALVGSGSVPTLPDHVTGLGPLERDALRDLYRAADLFAFPAEGEMLTLVMQEAMACGLPVLAAYEPEYALYDFGPDDIAFVPASGDFGVAIRGLLADGDRMAAMGAAARQVATERFDWRRNMSLCAAGTALAPTGEVGDGEARAAVEAGRPSAEIRPDGDRSR